MKKVLLTTVMSLMMCMGIYAQDYLNPPKANISMTELSVMDGSFYNSARLGARNIVLDLIILDNSTIEQSRHNLYKFLPIKSKIRFEVHTDEEDIYTEGYIEYNDVKIFSNRETASISILCPDPYFYSIEDEVISEVGVSGAFEFPFSNELGTQSLYFGDITRDYTLSVISYSNIDVGFIMDIHINGGVGDLLISNQQTSQSMALYLSEIGDVIGSQLQVGDLIRVNTCTGKKSVNLIRSGLSYNILSCLPRQIDWIRIIPGINYISINGSGLQNINTTITIKRVYEGA